MIWHSADKEQVLRELNVNTELGLNSDEVIERRGIYGKNTITNKHGKSFLTRFTEQLSGTGAIILFICSALSLASQLIFSVGSILEPIMMLVLTVAYAAVGAFERHSANVVHEKLKSTTTTSVTVKRDGENINISADELVPGDVILLFAGDYIPADARVFECKNFYCDESAITGSFVPEEKQGDSVLDDITPIEDRINMVYAGCSVCSGDAAAVVVATGINTELGRTETISKVDKTVSSSPLKARMISAAEKITVALLIICGLIFFVGLVGLLINRENFAIKFLALVSSVGTLFASIIPEFLIAATAVIISISIKKAADKKAVIKNLSTLETLGNVSVICCDKTGNMTEKKNSLAYIFDGESICDYKENSQNLPAPCANLLTLAALCSDATVYFENGKPIADGQPAEVAIVTAMAQSFKRGKEDLDSTCPRLCSLPFDKERRLMTTVNMIDSRVYAITKGAPETVLSKCLPFDKQKAEDALRELTSKGLRVIAVAYKPLAEAPLNPTVEEIECELNFSGLVAISNPISDEAKASVATAKSAGIRTIMVTGDHLLTATATANELGILGDGYAAMTSSELVGLSDDELAQKIDSISVFARITPNDKLRIVNALKTKGETVIMTGDGVEDAAALNLADIGCALGEWGTDVAKSASDITLKDDRFSAIVDAIKEGRTAFENIRKAAHFILSAYIGELIAVLISMIVFGISPLTCASLIWINLIIATIPAFAIGSEPTESFVMNIAPRDNKKFFFTKELLIEMFWQGGLLGIIIALGFILGYLANGGNIAAGYTVCFITLALCTSLHTFNVRSVKDSFINLGILKNKELLIGIGICVVLLLIATLSPISYLLGLAKVAARDWLIAILLSVMPIVIGEGVKLLRKLLEIIKEDK